MKTFVLTAGMLLFFSIIQKHVFSQTCPSTLTLTVASTTGASCPNGGSVTLGGSGVGNSGVIFSVISGPSNVGVQQNSEIFNSLSAGSYTFRASCNGQTRTVSANVGNLYTPMNPSFSVSVADLCEDYAPGGTLTVSSISGGRGPLSYSFVENSQANYDDALSVYTSSNTFSTASWGTYQVRVKDACGAFITKTINVGPSYAPVSFAGANIDFNNTACDSASALFWLNNDNHQGIELNTYSKLRFRIYEKASDCTPGALIKEFEMQGSDAEKFVIPRRDVVVEVTTPCGDSRTACYDYPDNDSLQSNWVAIVNGCGTEEQPYSLSIRHLNNRFSKVPFTVKLYNNSTNTLIYTNTYTSNDHSDVYNYLTIDEYRLEVTDACGASDTILIQQPAGQPAIAPVGAGTNVDPNCTFVNGKTTVQLMLTGIVSDLDIATLTITSGPDNIGQTAYYNTYNNGRFYFHNLTPGAVYGITLTTICSTYDLSFEVPNDSWRAREFTIDPTVTQQCGGAGTINANVVLKGWGYFRTELWSEGAFVAASNSGVYANIAPGLYEIRATHIQSWCDGVTQSTITDTARVYGDGAKPEMLHQFPYVCENGTTANVNVEIGGFAPFRYELKRISPSPQASYTVVANNAAGAYTFTNLDVNATYSLVITDNCGKSTVSQITTAEVEDLEFVNFYQPCKDSPYGITAPYIPGATYRWTQLSSGFVISNSRELYFPSYAIEYDGEYLCSIELGGGCSVRDMHTIISSGACMVLPVRLDSWNVSSEGCSAVLAWRADDRLEGYVIEQSSDGFNFKTVRELDLKDFKDNGSTNYQFRIADVPDGANYFRLKLVYNKHRSEYSPVRSIRTSCDDKPVTSLRVSPNPVISAEMNIVYYSSSESSLDIIIVDNLGVTMKKTKHNVSAGLNKIPMNVVGLRTGIYFVRVMDKKGIVHTTKFLRK